MISSNFNRIRFYFIFIIFAIVIFVSLVNFAAKEEGTIDSGALSNFMAEAYAVLRLPSHALLDYLISFENDTIHGIAGLLFFPGLFFNAGFYGFLIELVIKKSSSLFN